MSRHTKWSALLVLLPGTILIWLLAAGKAAPANAGAAKAPDAAPPAAAPAATASGAAPATIELIDVPRELTLPAESKSNYFVTAMIRGAVPKEVWLGRSADAPFTVTVPPFGDGRYQINLADNRVSLALNRTGGSGQCYVFARMPDGQIVQSAAVRFAMSSPTIALSATYGGATHAVGDGAWLPPGETTKLEIEAYPSLPGLVLKVEADGKSWPLQPTKGVIETNGSSYALDITPEIAAAWAKAGSLRATWDSDIYNTREAKFSAIPTRLELPADGLTLHAKGNSEVVIPSSNKYLFFHIGNVSEGAADVVIRRANEQVQKNDPPVGVARVERFGGDQFVWVITEANPAPDGGSIELRMLTGPKAEPFIVRTLIHQVRKMDTRSSKAMTFNGKEYERDEAAEQLAGLYEHAGAGSISGLLEAIHQREQQFHSEVKLYPQQEDSSGLTLTHWITKTVRSMGWEPIAPPAARASSPGGAVASGTR